MESQIKIPINTDFNKIDLFKSEIISIPNLEADSVFKTMMNLAIRDTEIFNTLIEKMEPVDFQKEVGVDIELLREKVNQNSDSRIKSILEKEISKSMPKPEQQYVIITNKLLELAEKENFGLAISNAQFFYYNCRFWEKSENEILASFLGNFAEKAGLERLVAQQFKVKELLYKQFVSDATIPNFKNKFSDILIPLKNGTLYINSGKYELREFRKEDFLKYQLSFDFKPEAKAPLFLSFLDRVLPDEKLQMILFEFLGYVLAKDLKLEKMLMLLGSGKNGKSVVFDVVYALFGKQNITSYSLKSLCEHNSYSRASIQDSLLNYSSELGGRSMEIDLFKKLSSNEPVEARFLHKNSFIIENYCRFMFNCNSLPKEVENNEAYYRRFIIIPFNVTISIEEQDVNLAKKIIENELEGVFNLVIAGMERLILQNKFTQSDIVNEEIEKYKNESNSVNMFLDEENYKISLSSQRPSDNFYLAYKEYSMNSGFSPFTKTNFNKQLKSMGYKIERGKAGGYYQTWVEKKIPEIDELFENGTFKKDSAILIDTKNNNIENTISLLG